MENTTIELSGLNWNPYLDVVIGLPRKQVVKKRDYGVDVSVVKKGKEKEVMMSVVAAKNHLSVSNFVSFICYL